MASPNYNHTTPAFDDPTVDRLADSPSGVIDQTPALSFDMADPVIIKSLEQRIQNSKTYWDQPEGHNLAQSRNETVRMYLGKQQQSTQLYRFQTAYVENQVYVAEEAIVSYLTARNGEPEVFPAQDTVRSKVFAKDLEKALTALADKIKLQQKSESSVRNALNKRLGLVYFYFDPEMGDNGEICCEAVDPDTVVVDKHAKLGENPKYICRFFKMDVNEILSRWPSKKEEVFRSLGIVRGTPKQLDEVVNVRGVWLTHYDKKFQKQEGVVYYFNDVVLEKSKNPNWLYADKGRNFLSAPLKPFIPLNFDNDGNHYIDVTTPIEQAATMQSVLNKRGRQLMEVADKANGLLVVSSDSGLTKDDLQNMTGDPNQRLIIKTAGQSARDMVYRVDPPVIPQFLMADKVDLRTQLHSIAGTPSEFTGGSDGSDEEKTLGQSQMKKNQASGRQDLFARSIDRFNTDVYNFMVQMMVVWYTDKHMFTYNGGDGEFDYVVMNRELIEDGIVVNVKSGTNLPFDKERQQYVALAMAKMKLLSPLDIYKMLSIPNPQQVYDNYAKFTADPASLARSAEDEKESNAAYVAYTEIMNGKDAEEPSDTTLEFVLSLRKLMLRDEFFKKDKKLQNNFIKYVEKAVKSLELRSALDQMSENGGPASLDPAVPIQPPQPAPTQGAPAPPLQTAGAPTGSAMPPAPNMPVSQNMALPSSGSTPQPPINPGGSFQSPVSGSQIPIIPG